MKKIIFALLLLSAAVQAQTRTINYQEAASTTYLNNPERGFMYEIETMYSNYTGYKPLSVSLTENQNYLLNQITANNVTLIRLIIRLDDFKTVQTLTPQELQLIRNDFATLRTYRLKCVLRFSYSSVNHSTAGSSYNYEPTEAILLGHISQLQGIISGTGAGNDNQDVISAMEAGFIGDYGEWYYSKLTSEFGVGDPDDGALMNSTQLANRKAVADQILTIAPSRMVAFRTVFWQKMEAPTLANPKVYPKYDGSVYSRIALHDDAFVSSLYDAGTFRNLNSDNSAGERSYLATKSKTTFSGGESDSGTNAFSPCYTAQPTIGLSAVQQLAAYHYNYMNIEFSAPILSQWQSQGCFDEIKNHLGYRFVLQDLSLSPTGKRLNLHLANSGYANVFNPRPVNLVFRSTSSPYTNYRVVIEGPWDGDPQNPPAPNTPTEIRAWYAGTTITLGRTLQNLSTVPNGTYDLYLELPDANATLATYPEYSIRLANSNTYTSNGATPPKTFWDAATGMNNLFISVSMSAGTLTGITSRPGNADAAHELPAFAAMASPNPFTDSFSLQLENAGDETAEVTICDLLGKVFVKEALSPGQLPDAALGRQLKPGVYILTVKQGENIKQLRLLKK